MHRFELDEDTRQLLTAQLQAFEDKRMPLDAHKHAAVALAIFDDGTEASLILTRRAIGLRAHGGQWSVPGGRVDEGETAEDAALRELHEEVNLSLSPDNIIGTLDDYQTRSGYVMTPVVVWTEASIDDLQPNPEEVSSIHSFRFSELLNQASPYLENIPESEHQVLSMHYRDDRIFAPTGALLYQFREVALRGRNTRVAHYDQPFFAWR